jgi:hypothetical protein
MRVYVPPLSSEQVGELFELTETDEKTRNRSPTAGVIVQVRSLVPVVSPPAAEVRRLSAATEPS